MPGLSSEEIVVVEELVNMLLAEIKIWTSREVDYLYDHLLESGKEYPLGAAGAVHKIGNAENIYIYIFKRFLALGDVEKAREALVKVVAVIEDDRGKALESCVVKYEGMSAEEIASRFDIFIRHVEKEIVSINALLTRSH